MSNHRGEVAIDWGDGTYTFRLRLIDAIELQSKCEAPIATIVSRVNGGGYSIADIRETIRLGLIGGGLKPHDALRLVRTYVDDRPLIESYAVARLILGGLMFGFAESPLVPAAAGATATTTHSASTPPPSTEPPIWQGLEDLLETSRSGRQAH